MENTFIMSIRVGKVRHLENILIEISDTQRKHLILTGKNGSGKTSLLEAMNAIIIPTYGNFLNNQNASTDKYQHVEIIFEQPMLNISNLKMLYISTMSGKFELPKALEENHEKWFDNLLEALQSIYDCQDLRLYKDNKNFTFMIEKPGQKPLSLHEMSGGYSSFINIYMELLAQLGSTDVVIDCGKSAIAMIDGVETHLHIEMQKKVLPFLANKFPNVQFIVTTHSPFVLMSTRDTLVYDLGKDEPFSISQAKSQNDILREYLGVPTTMPVWAEKRMAGIQNKYLNREPDNISLAELKKELTAAGLEEYFPDTTAMILETK